MGKRQPARARDPDRPKLPPGRPSVFRGKNRARPIQIYITDAGYDALMRGCRRSGLSRPDYIERLIHEADRGPSRTVSRGAAERQEQRA